MTADFHLPGNVMRSQSDRDRRSSLASWFLITITLACGSLSAESSQAITLEQAFQYTLQYNSKLDLAQTELEKKQLEIDSSRLWANPNLELGMENINGNYQDDNLEQEEEIKIIQRIEPFGKRGANIQLARAEKEVTQAEVSRLKAALLLETSQRFYTLLMHHKKLAIAKQNLKSVEEHLGFSEELYEAGKIPLTDLRRTRIEVMTYKLKVNKEEQETRKSKLVLRSLWDRSQVRDFEPVGDLSSGKELPKKPEIETLRRSNPDLLHLESDINRAYHALNVHRKSRWPEVGLMAGIKRGEASRKTGIQLGVEIDLPIFNSGKEEVAKSLLIVKQKETQRRYRESILKSEIDQVYMDLVQSHAMFQSLESEILPLAELELETLQLSYKAGKHSYLDVLDRMQILFRLRRQIIDLKFDYMLMISNLKFLSGEFSQ